MQIGNLRQLVTIQSATQARDAVGGVTETWSNVATVWANVKPLMYLSGIEALSDVKGRETINTSYNVTIRFRTDVTEQHRLVWGTTVLDIRRVLDTDGRRQWLELACEAV